MLVIQCWQDSMIRSGVVLVFPNACRHGIPKTDLNTAHPHFMTLAFGNLESQCEMTVLLEAVFKIM